MAAPAIGIDLGTTFSCVAVFQHDKVEIIANDLGNRIEPSFVAFTDTERLIGDAAKNQVAINPEDTVFDAKRLIGRKYTDIVESDMKYWPFKVVNDGGKPKVQVEYKKEVKTFAPEEISSMVLTKMKETAEAFLGKKVTDAVITVPAYFNDSQRRSTKDAGVIAGLNVLNVINEPTAAALAYGIDKDYQGKKNVMVFDLGGGTFDVSILTIKDGYRFTVKSTAGDLHLGGEDFDIRMVEHFVEEFKKKNNEDISDNARAMRRLRSACERAKRDLSCSPEATIEIDSLDKDVDFNTRITRERFEDLCSDLFKMTIEPVEKALKDAELDKQDIHEVVLVGGSTRIPKIQKLLQDFMGGKELNKSMNPDEAVAYGAAVQAAVLSGSQNEALIKVVDVAHHSIHYTAGNKNTELVKRNTEIPYSIKRLKIQSGVKIKVFEKETTMTNLLSTFELVGIPPAPRGIPQSKVFLFFNVDENGILNVTDKDFSAGKSNYKVIITNDKSRPSKEDIDKMLADAKRNNDEDNKQRDRVKAKNNLETRYFQYKSAVDNDINGKLTADDKETVIKKCDDVIRWLESNTSAEKEDYEHQMSDLQQVCSPIMVKLNGDSRNGDNVDVNGILNVTLGNQVTITNDKSRPSKEDIDKNLADAKRNNDEDNKQRDRVEAKNNLEIRCFQYKSAVNDDNGKLTADDKETVIKKCDDVIRCFESNTSAKEEDYEHQMSDLEQVCSPIMVKHHGNGDGAQNDNKQGQCSNEEEQGDKTMDST